MYDNTHLIQGITYMGYRFFLVNAAHIMILGAVWMRQQRNIGYGSPVTADQSRELSAINAAIGVLDFCGQRNVFARKYASLIKGFRHQLDNGLPSVALGQAYLSSAPRDTFMNLGSRQSSLAGVSQPPTDSGSIPESQGAQGAQGVRGTVDQSGASTSSLSDEDARLAYDPTTAPPNTRVNSWAEHFGAFYPTDDVLPYGAFL